MWRHRAYGIQSHRRLSNVRAWAVGVLKQPQNYSSRNSVTLQQQLLPVWNRLLLSARRRLSVKGIVFSGERGVCLWFCRFLRLSRCPSVQRCWQASGYRPEKILSPFYRILLIVSLNVAYSKSVQMTRAHGPCTRVLGSHHPCTRGLRASTPKGVCTVCCSARVTFDSAIDE